MKEREREREIIIYLKGVASRAVAVTVLLLSKTASLLSSAFDVKRRAMKAEARFYPGRHWCLGIMSIVFNSKCLAEFFLTITCPVVTHVTISPVLLCLHQNGWRFVRSHGKFTPPTVWLTESASSSEKRERERKKIRMKSTTFGSYSPFHRHTEKKNLLLASPVAPSEKKDEWKAQWIHKRKKENESSVENMKARERGWRDPKKIKFVSASR